MTNRFATLGNGVDIAYDVIGDLSCPVVMPILGITDNLTDWPENLCAPLVQAGYCVVRHETRDMGWSTQMEGAHYDMENIAADVVGLMNHLRIGSADLLGYSLGGAVAQLLALTAPNRVRRLVALQSTNYNPSLPPRSPAVLEAMKNACTQYETEAEAVAALKAVRLACNGSLYAMSDEEARKSAEGSVARGYHPHGTARLIAARQRTAPFHERLAQITCPMLVLQGSDDPIFPIGHGEDIARRVPGAELIYLQGAGHNHPQSLIPQLVARIRDFLLSRASGAT
jgi:pimeloyl-ACP methyl ester carboxylesterase